jgi:NAD(P)-dependent dehydrogenase (short-subunit alcohol dehydrogenase family)
MLGGMDLTGASALVTGAASGIGAAVARRLAGLGARVVVADVQAEKGEALAAEIGGLFAPVDVTDTAQVRAAVERAVELGPLRAVVCSAGIGPAQRTIGRDGEFDSAHDLELYKRVIAINLIGTFDTVRLGATAMSRNDPDDQGERGAIVTLASVAAFDGQIGQAAYSSSKGGVVGMTLPVARDLSAVGIRLSTVAPGLIDTPIYGEGEKAEEFKAKLGESVLFPKRLGDPDELASMVVECLTNPYMNGSVVRVDGGIRMPPK